METYSTQNWSGFWYNSILFMTVLLSLRLLISKKTIAAPTALLYFFGIGILLFFTSEPIFIYDDKYNYMSSFESVFDLKRNKFTGDFGFILLSKCVKYFFNSFYAYLVIIASIYIFGYLKFIKHFFTKEHQFIVFFATICSLGFYAYGTNTLRQGMGLSLFLIAIVYQSNRLKHLFFTIIAVLIHKSLIIPAVAFYIIKKYNPKNNFIYFWIFCLVLTLMFGNAIAVYLGDFVSSSDVRLNNYVTGKNDGYKAGFKLNFLIYSVAPIVYGLKIKSKINSEFYNRMLSLYIVVNAVWLLVIRIAFTDRFAYLSWFLIPFIFLYPLSIQKIYKHQNAIIALIIAYLSIVCYIIATK